MARKSKYEMFEKNLDFNQHLIESSDEKKRLLAKYKTLIFHYPLMTFWQVVLLVICSFVQIYYCCFGDNLNNDLIIPTSSVFIK